MAAAEKAIDKRKVRGEESRSQILQAAITSIATNGLGNLTLDRVAEHAGISRGLVVFHFKSKSNLVEEVLNYLGNRYAEGWYAALEQPAESNLEKLLQLTDYDVNFGFQHPKYVSAWHAFWGEARGNVLYHDLSLPRDERYSREMEQLLASMIEDSGQDMDELPLIITGLFAMLFGIWLESHLDPDPEKHHLYLNSVRHFLARNFPDHRIPLVRG